MANVGESKGRHGINSESLYQKWLVSPEAAIITVQHTTERGVRKILHPSLSRQFKINDRELRYNRLQYSVLTDTM